MSTVRAKRLLVAALFGVFLLAPANARAAPILSESFTDISTLVDWIPFNLSTPGGTTSWFQGNPAVFTALDGTNGYIAANFNSAGFGGNVNNYLITPLVTVNNGDTFSFYTRTALDGSLGDGLEVLLSAVTPEFISDFTISLLTITPPNYQSEWTQYSLTIAGLAGPTDTRLAFRYFVNDTSVNGDYIGIDDVTLTPVPEPATLTLLGLGLAGLGARRYRQSKSGA
jgi:hypothetical protein